MKIGKKGITFGQLSSVALIFVVTGVTLGIGAYINTEIITTGGFAAGSVANLTVENATQGIGVLAQWLPIIAVVIAAGVVIGVLVTAFAGRGRY